MGRETRTHKEHTNRHAQSLDMLYTHRYTQRNAKQHTSLTLVDALECGPRALTVISAQVDVHVVRYVSPQKPMLCLSFRLPLEVAIAEPIKG